jgi:NifB/MoaA-like Fe-S oxidoreductase
MREDEPIVLICGSLPMPNAEKAVCSQCGAIIWPTIGSINTAQKNKMSLLCLDCFHKLDEIEFIGFMEHGAMLPKDVENRLLVEFERVQKKKCPKAVSAKNSALN